MPSIRILGRSILLRTVLIWVGVRTVVLIASAFLGIGLVTPAGASFTTSTGVVLIVVALIGVDTWRANEWTLLRNLGAGPTWAVGVAAIGATAIEALAVAATGSLV